MPLSKESEEIAEMKYEVAVQQIKKKYGELTRHVELTYRTTTGREREILKVLPPRLEETAKALLDCYFERFEADGLLPEQADLERLDKKIENIFCGGHGDHSGAIDLDTKGEIERLEKQAQKQLKVRTLELKLRKASNVNIIQTDERFTVGDHVKMTVGGPVMTVDGITTDGKIICTWFEGERPRSRECWHRN